MTGWSRREEETILRPGRDSVSLEYLDFSALAKQCQFFSTLIFYFLKK